jgi:hypothetical protein
MVDSNMLITYASFQNLYSAIIQVLCAFFKHRPPIDRGNIKVAFHATFSPAPPAILYPSTKPTATHHHTKKHLRAAECHQRQRVHLVYHASHIQRVISFLVFSFWHKYQLQIYVFFFYQQNFFSKKM